MITVSRIKNNTAISRPSKVCARILFFMSLFLATITCGAQGTDPLEASRESGRPALIYFSGSDWCANCKAFSRDVLSKPEVQAVSTERYVSYTADRPIRKPLDADTERLNALLVQRYNASNIFPLLVVIGTDGRVLDRITYERGLAAERYAERLRKWSGLVP